MDDIIKVGLHSKHPHQPGSSLLGRSAAELSALEYEFTQKQVLLMDWCTMVDPMVYYRDMFPAGSFEPFREKGEPNDPRRPNGLITIMDDSGQRGRTHNRVVFDDLEEIQNNLDKDFVLIAPVGYSGRRRLSQYAYHLFGFVIDLDDVGPKQARDLLYQMQNGILPQATYVVNSGTGLHVVYLFEEPIPAMQQYYESLNRLKADISNQVWNSYTSRSKDKQSQGIFQAFRMVGSPSKLGADYRVTAFKAGPKTTIHSLNEFADKENRCIFDDWNHTSLEEAQEQWPDWYQRRVVEQRPVGDYDLDEQQLQRRRSWYDAWLKRIRKGAIDGNRFYCVAVLFTYACKAEIPPTEAYQDALELLPWLDGLTASETNHFTEQDILDAMQYYDRKYIKLGRKGIKRMTQIDIGQTKRNGKTRAQHIKVMNFYRDEIHGKTDWRNKDGRPSKQTQVETWQAANPNGSKADCARETGIDPKTIRKWWKG